MWVRRLLIDAGETSPLWVAPSLRQAVLNYLRILAKNEPVSEPACIVLLWLMCQVLALIPVLEFLQFWAVTYKFKQNIPFPPPSCFCSEHLITATEMKLEHYACYCSCGIGLCCIWYIIWMTKHLMSHVIPIISEWQGTLNEEELRKASDITLLIQPIKWYQHNTRPEWFSSSLQIQSLNPHWSVSEILHSAISLPHLCPTRKIQQSAVTLILQILRLCCPSELSRKNKKHSLWVDFVNVYYVSRVSASYNTVSQMSKCLHITKESFNWPNMVP